MQAARRSLHPHADNGVHNAAPVPQWPFRHEFRKRRWKPGRPTAHIRMERVRFLLVPRDLPDPLLYLGLPVWPDTAARYSFQFWKSGQEHLEGRPSCTEVNGGCSPVSADINGRLLLSTHLTTQLTTPEREPPERELR